MPADRSPHRDESRPDALLRDVDREATIQLIVSRMEKRTSSPPTP
jgi:hypothetical protein